MSISKTILSDGNSLPIKFSSSHAFGRVNFNMFFDRVSVTSAFDRKETRVLSRTGAWARGAMRRSIRKGGKKGEPSKVGKPPKYWTRGFASLKDGIFFQASLEHGAVIIGPNKLRTQVIPTGKASSAQLLEEGGAATITSFRFNKPRANGSQRPPSRKTRRGNWKARPFAAPIQKPAQAKMLEFINTIPV